MALEITWHRQGNNANMPGDPIKSETLTLSGTAATSAVAPDEAETVVIIATENCRYAKSENPTATATAGTSGHYLLSGFERWLPARPLKSKISAIQAS